METDALDQRQQFVIALERGHWSMTELCARFGISRPTGYKWLARYRVAAALIAARREYGWGARKLLQVARRQHPT